MKIRKSIISFGNGPAYGIDKLLLQHFKDLTQFFFFIFTSFLSWARKSVRVSKEVAALILMHFHLSTKVKQKLQSLLFLRYFISFPPSFCLNVRSVLGVLSLHKVTFTNMIFTHTRFQSSSF